jgi:peroxiredoxin
VRFTLALVLVLSMLCAGASRAEMVGGLTVGDVAPDANVFPVNGAAAALSALQGNKVLLFVVFRTSCPHCQREVKELNEVFAKFDPAKVAIISAGLGDTLALVNRFAERFGVKYPLAVDTDRKLQRPFNIQGVPTYFILDAERKVRYQGHTETAAKLIEQIQSLLGR